MQTYLKLLSSIFGTGPKAKFKEPPVWNVWIMYLLVLSRTGVALSDRASIWYPCSPGHGDQEWAWILHPSCSNQSTLLGIWDWDIEKGELGLEPKRLC